MLRILKLTGLARILSVGVLAIRSLNAFAQGAQNESDTQVTFELQTAFRKNIRCSDDLVQRSIDAIERRRNGPLIYTLANIVSTKKVSPTAKKLIEDFIHSQLGSSDPGMRRAAADTVAMV